MGLSSPTSCDLVDFVLNEEVDQGNNGREKAGREYPAILDSLRVGRAENEAAICPWNCGDQVRDHENIVPIVVVR